VQLLGHDRLRLEAFDGQVRLRRDRLHAPQEIGGIAYEGSALLVSSQTRPHQTSLAVWSVPSPVRMAGCFAVTVGAKSSGACALGGARIEIRDETGAPAGRGILGDTPWPRTDALYSGFEPASRTVEIAADVSVQFELTRRPKELTAWD